MRRTRGFIDLVFDLVEETTDLVERTHDAVVARSARRLAPIEPARRIRFAGGAALPGMNHLHIANHPEVYEALRDFLSGEGRAS